MGNLAQGWIQRKGQGVHKNKWSPKFGEKSIFMLSFMLIFPIVVRILYLHMQVIKNDHQGHEKYTADQSNKQATIIAVASQL